jgi:alkanesulfonate monooxygenase SsuD/methylene tetrahydromethanopterin reductase-like flavin-dependent oxidoreductase (luciferase family)
MLPDPLIALSVAATVSDEIELGTAILQLPLYNTIDLAHRVYSLQQICGNRFLFGVGAGSTEKDFAAFDRDFASRFKRFNAQVRQLRQFYAGGGAVLSPWPELAAGPPLLFGTWGNGVERAAREFDGWIASGHYRTPDEVCEALVRYRSAGGGRAIVSTLQINRDTDLGELKAKLDQFTDAGFDDAVVMLLPGAPDAAIIRRLVA